MQSLLYLEAKTRERLEGERLAKEPSEGVVKSVLNRVELFDPPATPVIDREPSFRPPYSSMRWRTDPSR